MTDDRRITSDCDGEVNGVAEAVEATASSDRRRFDLSHITAVNCLAAVSPPPQ
jgi:hypothetical protein